MKKISLIIIFAIWILTIWCTQKEMNNEDTQKLENFSNLNAKEFKKLRESWEYEVIDIRSPWELEQSWHIPGAKNIEYYASNFNENLENLEKDKKYLIYCNSWNRTADTMNTMKKMWFKEVHHLDGGVIAWLQWNNKIEKCLDSWIC